ncbi:helix-turn-helix transcriptional regulator [Micropruina glycogenica]|uniref:Helix-turn-helix type 11 domain protein n=1 Tax=Micropruina glycogenica TaxID=75385 RepID=A0A2N9JIE1_9ACTN|nr:YafY family protein [Micropruina glycogenica]SPD87322.1 Helix-turn-helix type 11 domain protein [Micropruina glycogenica]
MRADRLLQIMALLRRHGRLPARRLAELLEVSERTILRDMESLSAAGVPVYTDRGRGGGCSLLPGYRTEVSGLSPAEAQALFAWTSGSGAAELGLSGELSSALTKLSATVPAPALEQAEALASVVVVDKRRWFAAADEVPMLPVLRDAATRRRRVSLTYAAASGGLSDARAPSVRVVDPYGLVENAGRWYLLAARDGERRTYRVSRIVAAEVLDEAAQIPEGFDLAEAWEEQRAALEHFSETCTINVALDPAIVDVFTTHARFQLAVGTDVTRQGNHEGWPVLQCTFRAWRAAVSIVLAYGGQVRLLAPAYLRARVLELAEASVAAHKEGGSWPGISRE